MKALRRFAWTLAILTALLAPAYYLLVMRNASQATVYPLDVAELRQLASSMPGLKPGQIRVEQVAAFQFSEAMQVAGDSWRAIAVPVYSYQLVYPDQTLIIDAGMPQSMAQPDFMMQSFDEAAYQRVVAALDQAAAIVITHEHFDHSGGVADHPRFAALLPRLRLTAEQLAHPDRMAPGKLKSELMQNYQPLRYERVTALAPGVVLIKAPGHTPGSQIVFVQLADGRELLFLGDVAWRTRNIEVERERPLFMTLMIKEDRGAVLGQLKALNRLLNEAPELKIVPGHDGPVVEALLQSGYLQRGFQP